MLTHELRNALAADGDVVGARARRRGRRGAQHPPRLGRYAGGADLAAGVPNAHPALLRSAVEGADTTVWLLAVPDGHATSGLFWHDRAPGPAEYPTRRRPTPEQVRALWEYSVETTGRPSFA